MYYIGMPFNEYSLIKEIPEDSKKLYFRKVSHELSVTTAIYEGVVNNEVIMVVYVDVAWNNPDLIHCHSRVYGDSVLYYVEEELSASVFRTSMVCDRKVTGYAITQYDEIWRVNKEQSFDEKHLLVEYRQMYYEGDARVPRLEKIFFSSWHISEETYGV